MENLTHLIYIFIEKLYSLIMIVSRNCLNCDELNTVIRLMN